MTDGKNSPDAGVPPQPKDAGLPGGVASADKNLGSKPVGSGKQSCPLQDKIKLVELVEVVVQKGKRTTQPVKGRKQYINLDDKFDPNKPHPEYGRCVRLKARVEWESGNKSCSLAGQKIYWYSKAGPTNRVGTKLTGQQREAFGSQGSTKTKEISTTDQKGWTPVMEFYLSQYGGDQFEIFATTNSNYTGGLKAGSYEVWRRMWYEITEMKKKSGGKYQLPNDALADIKNAFQRTYIEFVDTGRRQEGEFKENLLETNTWADRYCSPSCVPWKIHFAVMNHAAKKEEKVDFDGVNKMTYTMKTYFRPYDFDGTNWLISAEYTSQAANQNKLISEFTGWRPFPTGSITLTGAKPYNQIRVDFTKTGINPVSNPQVVRVKYLEAGVALGWGGTSLHLVICRGAIDEYYSAADIRVLIAGTCVHEPGHSFGLVGMRETHVWKTSDATQTRHCKFNTCVMYYAGRTPIYFHGVGLSDPGCETYMRGLDMSREKMNPIWKFPRGG